MGVGAGVGVGDSEPNRTCLMIYTHCMLNITDCRQVVMNLYIRYTSTICST